MTCEMSLLPTRCFIMSSQSFRNAAARAPLASLLGGLLITFCFPARGLWGKPRKVPLGGFLHGSGEPAAWQPALGSAGCHAAPCPRVWPTHSLGDRIPGCACWCLDDRCVLGRISRRPRGAAACSLGIGGPGLEIRQLSVPWLRECGRPARWGSHRGVPHLPERPCSHDPEHYSPGETPIGLQDPCLPRVPLCLSQVSPP